MSTYQIEIFYIVIRMMINGRDVTGFLIPLAVVIVSHNADPV